jgi:hypothetical protein
MRFGCLHPDEPFTVLGLEPGRPASLSGKIAVGDKLIAVDGWPCYGQEDQGEKQKTFPLKRFERCPSQKREFPAKIFEVPLLRRTQRLPTAGPIAESAKNAIFQVQEAR